MSKNYIIKKTTPNEVMFYLHPISNQTLTKLVRLTNRMPQQSLPEDWAMGVFFDPEVYNMFRKGLFTFNDNDGVTKAAFEAGVYFDDKLDFTPANETDTTEILNILKAGKRQDILDACSKFSGNKVKEVAIAHCDELTSAVVSMLEKLWNIQLVMNQE